MEGWIKLHRKILSSKYGKNLELRGLFDSLLLMANHKEGFTADGTKLLPGQFMTSQDGLAKEFNVTRAKMQRLLSKLKDAKQIELLTSPKNTVITIINWQGYQVDELQTSYSRATDEQRASTNKNAKNNKNGKKNTAPLFSVEAPELEEELTIDQKASNVLTLFNSLTFKNFRPVPGNLKHINARLKEGYKLEEFKKVIQYKYDQWVNDPKMAHCIRPETILGNKFDSYLVEASDERLKEIEADAAIREFLPGFSA